jgi:hypothetical protein
MALAPLKANLTDLLRASAAASQNQENGFRFQPDAFLALIVERAV